MAKLKQETDQIRYSEQIGVNRGGGFAVAADAQMRTANAWDNLVGNFANFTLKETQEWGKKLGETTAKEYEFGQKEVQYIDADGKEQKQFIPQKFTTPDSLTTATSIEAFENDIYLKYQREVESSINEIILDERDKAETAYADKFTFENVVNTRLKPLLDNLEPTFKQVTETYIRNNVGSHGRMVQKNHIRFNQMKDNVSYNSEIKSAKLNLDKALIYGDTTLITENMNKLKTVIQQYSGKNVIDAIAGGKEIIKNAEASIRVFKLFQHDGLHIGDYDTATSNELINSIDNYEKIASLLQYKGPKQITIKLNNGNNVILTKEDIQKASGNNLGVINDVRIALANQANIMSKIAKEKTEIAGVTNAMKLNYENVSTGNNPTKNGLSQKEWEKKVYNSTNIHTAINDYNSNVEVEQQVTHENYIQSNDFIKWMVTVNDALPPVITEKINSSFENYNQVGIQELRDSSVIRFLTNFNHSFKTTIGGNKSKFITSNVSTVKLDKLASLGFSKSVQNKIYFLEEKLRLNPNMADAIRDMEAHFSNIKAEDYQTLKAAISIGSDGKYKGAAEINAYVDKKVIDILDKWTTWNPSLSMSLSSAVKNEIAEYIMKGHPIKRLGQLDSAILSSMQYVLDGKTGYGFSEVTYSPFMNMGYDKGDYGNIRHFVLDAAENFYALPTKGESTTVNILGVDSTVHTIKDGEMTLNWMKPIIMDMVKQSDDWDKMKVFKPSLGKNIFLQSTGFGTNTQPKYNLVWVDQSGQAQLITDKDGLPMYYDPSPDYTARYNKAFADFPDLEKRLDDYRTKRNEWAIKRNEVHPVLPLPKIYYDQSMDN